MKTKTTIATINGVELNETILESVQVIKDLNESNWTDKTLGKVMNVILNDGCEPGISSDEKLKLVSAVHHLQTTLRDIRHVEPQK